MNTLEARITIQQRFYKADSGDRVRQIEGELLQELPGYKAMIIRESERKTRSFLDALSPL
jgi:hypothetical protein